MDDSGDHSIIVGYFGGEDPWITDGIFNCIGGKRFVMNDFFILQ